MNPATVDRRFPVPREVPAPAGAEGWENMYSPYVLFSEDNREWEGGAFWYLDCLHRPEVEYPFDTIIPEAWTVSASSHMSRTFALPGANGLYFRILNHGAATTARRSSRKHSMLCVGRSPRRPSAAPLSPGPTSRRSPRSPMSSRRPRSVSRCV